jgi:hypothetical protein
MRCTRQVPPLLCDELACEVDPKPPREVEWLVLPLELLPDEDELLEPCQSDEEDRLDEEPQNQECAPLLWR